MNKDQIEGNWKQMKGKIQQQWGKLTDDDLDVIEGKREELIGRVQERYGIAREEAEKQVKRFRRARYWARGRVGDWATWRRTCGASLQDQLAAGSWQLAVGKSSLPDAGCPLPTSVNDTRLYFDRIASPWAIVGIR